MSKEGKKAIENLKSCNSDFKLQIETINNKYQTLMEENYSMKKELLNYERDIKVKSESITKLSTELEVKYNDK